jgi:hypothetical protein
MRCLAQVRVDTTRSFVQFRPVDLGRWKAIVSGQLTEARNNPDRVRLLFIDFLLLLNPVSAFEKATLKALM